MGVSGRLYAEATLTQKIEDWCGSYAHCFEDTGGGLVLRAQRRDPAKAQAKCAFATNYPLANRQP